jgi:hypothetical protein
MLRRSLIVALGSNSLWSETQRRPAAGALCHPDMWPACVACTPTELQRRVSRGAAAFCVRGRRRSSEGTAPNQPPDSAANSVPIGGPSSFLTRARTPPSRPGPVARASLVPVIWLLSAGARFQACEDGGSSLAGSSSLRLSNNELCSLEALPECLEPVLLLPHKLQWLDLSFNQISHIEPIASACPSLRLLYLHVNAVTEPRQLDALSQLAHLHTLTLHGNEVENAPNYRFRLASNLPTLKNLDFSALTIVEKDKARTWAAGQQARRRAQGRTM